MGSGTSRPLTERQRAVMERIDRRVPIKGIAQDLGVSETRINQHIRALKNIYEVENLGDLVEAFRAAEGGQRTDDPDQEGDETHTSQDDSETLKPYSEAAYKNSQIPDPSLIGENAVGIDPGELVMSDVLQLAEQAPWLRSGEPRVVPRALDGENAVLFRLAAIVGIAFGVLAAVVLTVTAAMTISEALDGRATVPVDEQGFS